MDSRRFVSSFDATHYKHPVIRDEAHARSAVFAHFQAMRAMLAQSEAEGVLIAVIGPAGDLEALRLLTSRESGGAMWCIGRHAIADIRLQASEDAPLRALAVHVVSTEMPHVRIIDLQTPSGFFVRGQGPCRDITLIGPALLELAGYLLIVAPTAGGKALRANSASAFWDVLAHPLVRDVVAMGGPIAEEDEEPVTSMRSFPHIGRDTTARAVFDIVFADAHIMSAVSPVELRRGVLCGRYARCELGGRALHAMQRVSRVHLLVRLAGERLYGFDLGSSCGTTLNGVTRRYFEIAPGDIVELGGEVRLRLIT